MFLADGQTVRQTDRVPDKTKLRVAIRNFAKASKISLNPT